MKLSRPGHQQGRSSWTKYSDRETGCWKDPDSPRHYRIAPDRIDPRLAERAPRGERRSSCMEGEGD